MGIIRFLLAVCVVSSHCGEIVHLPMMTGDVAVQLFYIISGFYMSIILNEKYNQKKKSYGLFITNRLLRLYPTYLIILLLTLGLCWLGSIKSGGQYHVKLDVYLQNKLSLSSMLTLIFTNLLILGQDIIMFLGLNIETGNLFFTSNFKNQSPELHTFLLVPQAWTLGLEIMFYTIAPFIVTKGLKKVILFIFLSLLVRYIVSYGLGYQNDPWGYRFFPSELLFFLLGYISYYILRKVKLPEINAIGNGVYIGLLILTILFYTKIPDYYISYIPFGIKQITLTLIFTLTLPFLFLSTEKNKLDRTIGELSYPIYISHMFIFMLLGMYGYTSSVWILAITIVFSYLINLTINNRIETYRQNRIKSSI